MLILKKLLFSVLLFAVITSGFNGIRIAAHATLSDAILILLAILWFLLFPLQRHLKLNWSITIALMIFYLVFMACWITGLSKMGVEEDIGTLAKILITFFGLPYLVADIARTDKQLETVITAYIATAIINVLISIPDTLGITHIQTLLHAETIDGWAYDTRFHGLTMHPNHLGQLCAIAAVLALGIYPKHSLWARGIWILGESLLIIGILGSGSRAALLSFGGVGLLLLFQYKSIIFSKPSRLILFIILGVICGSVFFYISQTVVVEGALARLTGHVEGSTQSDSERLTGLMEAVEDFSKSPLIGVGFTQVGGVENIVLQFLQAAGLLGVLGLIIYFYTPIKALIVSNKYKNRLVLSVLSSIGVYILFTQLVNLTYARFSLIPMGLFWSLQKSSKVMLTNINNGYILHKPKDLHFASNAKTLHMKSN